MALLSPASLWWLVPLIGAIIALYMLRMRRTDVRVPATFLWPAFTSDIRANAPFQRPRLSLLLVLQLLVAALIVTALAAPTRRTVGLGGAATVVVLDNSTAMQATDIAPSRFQAAVKRVRSLIGAMNGRDRMALIEARSFTRILFPLTSDKAAMSRSLRSLQPSDAPADMGEAMRLAAALVAGRAGANIIVLSDGDFVPIADFSPGQAKVTYETLGTSGANVGITAWDSAPTGNDTVQCFAAVKNYDTRSQPVTLTFRVDGSIADARRIPVAAGATHGVTFLAPARARVVELTISAPYNMLKSDDDATLFLRGSRVIRTLLVSPGDLFLERALSLDPQIHLERATDVPDDELAGSPGSGPYDLVVFDNSTPRPVKAPAVWSLGVPNTRFGVQDLGPTISPRVLDWSRDDPVMRYEALDDIAISRAHKVRLIAGSRAKILVQGSDGPLIVSATPPGERMLYVGWNVLDSDFPLRVSFPIFVANAVNWLTSKNAQSEADHEPAGITVRPGQTFSVPAPGGYAVMTAPDGTQTRMDGATGEAIVRSIDRTGIYSITGPQLNVRAAVNLLSEQAGEILPKTEMDLAGTAVRGSKNSGMTFAELWRAIVLAALALAAVEWWVFAKRS